ncbi:hypothetical protein FOCC_FOCC004059 [Frankliniella occidentalis]|nr:hypothetical protein FOCC_FOCC004059 [Frankliniella occidentalis]
MLKKIESIGISREDTKLVDFVTDGGSNVVNALDTTEFKRHYCLDHALNLCEKGAFSVNYFDLDRALTKRLANKGYEDLEAVRAILNDDIRAILVFLNPFENGVTRESTAQATTAQWPVLLDHVEPAESDEPMVSAMKDRVRGELVRMEAAAMIERCKLLVTFFKSSPGLMLKLKSKHANSLKQDILTMWNSHLTLLESLNGNMDKITEVLGEHAAATRNKRRLNRTDGISEQLLGDVVQFLKPFEVVSKRLEREGSPALSKAAYSMRELLDHCSEKPNDCEALHSLRTQLREEGEKAAADAAAVAATAAVARGTPRGTEVSREQSVEEGEEQEDNPDVWHQPEGSPPLSTVDAYMDVDDDTGVDELDRYMEDRIGSDVPPTLWRVARRYLAIQSSSAPAERVWSKTGLIITPRRSRIASDLVNAYVVIRSNRRNIRKQLMREKQ